MSRRTKALAMLAVWGAVTAPNATAQETARACPAGTIAVGDLGYERLTCSNCTQYIDEEQPRNTRWEFKAEPVVEGVRRGGPADGKLELGDVIVAIDGALITSAEGGRHFGQVEPGKPIDLTVRRGRREVGIEITPAVDCRRTRRVAPRPLPPDREAGSVPRAQARTPRPPIAPVPSTALPEGWFGFSLRCSDCGISLDDSANGVWFFSSPPIIEDVESESPADRGGIRLGDQIITIDGIDVTTAEGGASFGTVMPGDTVAFGIRRRNAEMVVQIAAGARERPSPAPPPGRGIVRVPPQSDVRRFSGMIGDALVEVTGGPIVVRRTEDEIVIRSGDITVRIKRTDR